VSDWPGDANSATAEPFARWIVRFSSSLKDRNHRAFEKAREALLAFANFGFRANAIELSSGPGGENAESGFELGSSFMGFVSTAAKWPKTVPSGLMKGAPTKLTAFSATSRDHGEKFDDAFGVVNNARFLDHDFARVPSILYSKSLMKSPFIQKERETQDSAGRADTR